MAYKFKALLASKDGDKSSVAVTGLSDADLMEGNVTVAIDHSTINYKDALALTGRAPIIRRWPLIPGIDFAGRVVESQDPRYAPDSLVILNGWGVGESHHGGFSQRARVQGKWLVPLPKTFTTAQAMAIGTAGYTAMLCVMALEEAGIMPNHGDIVVTGAAGGVGSVAIALLAAKKYRVIASSRGAEEEGGYLRDLGADAVIDAKTLSEPGKPLGKERWAGAVDSVGSHTLVNLLAQTLYGGAVAACGLAQGADLPGTVMPFILRGVRLLGVDSVNCPSQRRETAWARLAEDLDLGLLDRITTTRLPLAEVQKTAETLMAGKIRGRVVVDTLAG
jgi:acrylyl-CoA reductase (NADPH)